MRSWAARVLAFDTETTGLGADARVVEFGAALYEDGLFVAGCSILLNPGDIDLQDAEVKKALSVNHIDPASLKDAPTFAQEFSHIQHWLGQADTRVAHNTPFDLRMLNQEVKRAVAAGALRLPPKGTPTHTTLNTLALDLTLNPGKMARNLDAVAGRWGVPRVGNHRAQGDAMDCARVLLAMSEKCPEDLARVKAVNTAKEKEWEEIMRRLHGS